MNPKSEQAMEHFWKAFDEAVGWFSYRSPEGEKILFDDDTFIELDGGKLEVSFNHETYLLTVYPLIDDKFIYLIEDYADNSEGNYKINYTINGKTHNRVGDAVADLLCRAIKKLAHGLYYIDNSYPEVKP